MERQQEGKDRWERRNPYRRNTLPPPLQVASPPQPEDWQEAEEQEISQIARTDASDERRQPKRLRTSSFRKEKDGVSVIDQDPDGVSSNDDNGAAVGSPIKLFATEQDLKLRVENPEGDDEGRHHWSHSECETLREMLGFDDTIHETATTSKKLVDWIVISNYIIDFEFLLEQIPELSSSIPRVVVFYGAAETSPEPWIKQHRAGLDLQCLNPSEDPGSRYNPTSFRIPFGVHHSKFFLIGYRCANDDGSPVAKNFLRVVIHTANLRHSDIFCKTQAAYRQDFALKKIHSSDDGPSSTTLSSSADISASPFELTLLDYMDTYKFQEPRVWNPGEPPTFLRHILKRYDFSSARVVLVPSTPGYHKLDAQEQRGHLKVRQCIKQYVPPQKSEFSSNSSHIICQFSSLGSLSEKYLFQEFQTSFSSSPTTTTQSQLDPTAAVQKNNQNKRNHRISLKLVYPTVQEIRESVEGYRGGGSVPGSSQNVRKPFLQTLFCRWSAPTNVNPLHKPRNVPHIKTYYQIGRDDESFDYVVVTSHNLSKAAWGEIQNSTRYGGRRLFIRHWELGVFIAPGLLHCARMVPWGKPTGPGDVTIPLPYSLHPMAYDTADRAWAVDEHYRIPDRFGRHSCKD